MFSSNEASMDQVLTTYEYDDAGALLSRTRHKLPGAALVRQAAVLTKDQL
jgi:hypothetical protein